MKTFILLLTLTTLILAQNPRAKRKAPLGKVKTAQAKVKKDTTKADSLPISDTLVIETLDFKDADIRDVLRGLGVQYSINIWMAPEVKGRIPIHFNNIKVSDAITFIIKKYGFDYRVLRGIVEVYKPKEVVPPPPEVIITIKDSLMSVDLKEADIQAVVRNRKIA